MSNVSSATVADPRLLKAGFAKLRGDEIDFIMRSYEITLGRATTGPPTTKTADVGLGSNLNISRQHAKIHYNFDKGRFELVVLGKNGATVSGEPYVPGTPPVGLSSGTLITICDVSFWFLLPRRSALAASLSTAQSRPAQAVQNGGRPTLPLQPSRSLQPAAAPQPAPVLPAAPQASSQTGSGAVPYSPQLQPSAAQQQQQQQQQIQQQLWQQQLLQQQQQRQQQAALAASAQGSGVTGPSGVAAVPATTMSQGVALEVTQAQVQAYQAYYAQLQRQQLIQQLAAQQQQQAAQQQHQQPQ